MNKDLERLELIKYVISKYEITGKLDAGYGTLPQVETEYEQLKEKIEKSLEGIKGRDALIKRLQEEGLKNIQIVERLKDYMMYECNVSYPWTAKKVYDDIKSILRL